MKLVKTRYLLCMLSLLILKVSAQDLGITADPLAITLDAKGNSDSQQIHFNFTTDFRDLELPSNTPDFVRLNNSYSNSYKEAIQISLEIGDNPFLTVTANLLDLHEQGNYEVQVTLIADGKKQRLLFTLVRPSAQLVVENKVMIDFACGKIVGGDPLVVRETGGKSKVRDLKLGSPYFLGVYKDKLLKFTETSYSVEAGGYSSMSYAVDDPRVLESIPVGRYSGKLYINAPELADTVTAEFEFLKRRSKGYIVIILFLGVLVGFIVRVVLKTLSAGEEIRISIFTVLKRIADESSHIEDFTFRKGVEKQRTNLMQMLKDPRLRRSFVGIDSEGLKAEVDSAAKAFNDLMSNFTVESGLARGEVLSVYRIYEMTNWPPFMTRPIEELKPLLESASRAVTKFNNEIINNELEKIGMQAGGFVRDSKTSFVEIFKLLQKTSLYPLKAENEAESNKKIWNLFILLSEAGTTKQAEIENLIIPTKPSEIRDAFLNLEKFYQDLKEMLEHLMATIHGICTTDLSDKNLSDQEKEILRRHFSEWQSEVKGLIEKPIGNIGFTAGLLDASRLLDEVWKQMREKETSGPTPPSQDAPNFKAAAQSRLGPFEPPRVFLPSIIAAEIESGLSRSRKNWYVTSGLISIITLLLMAGAAYLLYAPIFIGTWPEMISMFLFAFGLNITADSIFAMVKS